MAKRKNRKVTAKKIRKTEITLTANRKYKDTVFRMLFSDRKNLLSLYNAINGTAYENADDLEIVTLENAIYMGMKNDLAFIIDTNLFLYEHQSTYNPNMPLRDLFHHSQRGPTQRSARGTRVRFGRCYIGWGDSVSCGREGLLQMHP